MVSNCLTFNFNLEYNANKVIKKIVLCLSVHFLVAVKNCNLDSIFVSRTHVMLNLQVLY